MNDTIEKFQEVETPANTGSEERTVNEDSATAGPPEGVPEKFWDKETNQVRIDALAKSYQELERKLCSVEMPDIPDTPDEYEVVINGDLLEPDPEVNHRLHAVGLTNEQVQETLAFQYPEVANATIHTTQKDGKLFVEFLKKPGRKG